MENGSLGNFKYFLKSSEIILEEYLEENKFKCLLNNLFELIKLSTEVCNK